MNEIAEAIGMGAEIELENIPLQHETKMAADMLGVNPIYLANEGNLVVFCSPEITEKTLKILHQDKYGKPAAVIGKIKKTKNNQVFGLNKEGEIKVIEHLYGQELPRLC